MSSTSDSADKKAWHQFTQAELDDLSGEDLAELKNTGWLAQHPEEQVVVKLEAEGTVFYEGNLYRDLDPHEESGFRSHARETYVIGDPISDLFHPVWQDEARKMNKEVADESAARRSGEK